MVYQTLFEIEAEDMYIMCVKNQKIHMYLHTYMQPVAKVRLQLGVLRMQHLLYLACTGELWCSTGFNWECLIRDYIQDPRWSYSIGDCHWISSTNPHQPISSLEEIICKDMGCHVNIIFNKHGEYCPKMAYGMEHFIICHPFSHPSHVYLQTWPFR